MEKPILKRRKLLVVSTLILFFIGVIVASSLFVVSLQPNARAHAALPRYDISTLKPGQLAILKGPILAELYNDYELMLLGFKSPHGKLHVWQVPVKNKKVGMPDLHWFRPIHDCAQFKLVEQSKDMIIACEDSEISNWWANQWRWRVNGENMGTLTDDMEEAKGMVEGDDFVYAKTR